MFLDGLVRRRIADLLRPWLAEEPQWEVKLGFLRSIAVARKLRFDCAVLNELIGHGGRLRFERVEVEELSVRVTYWSTPALDVEVKAVDVTLSAEETVSVPMAESSDTSLLEKRKLLRKIDPEGSALHENLEKIMNNCSSESWMRYSLVNLILTKCCLNVHGIRLRMEFPFSDEGLLWDVVELNAQCQHLNDRCLTWAFTRSLFLPLRESSFEIAARGMKVVITGKGDENHVRSIFSSKEPCIGICLKDFCLVDLMVRAQEVNFAFSPSLLPMFTAFGILTSVEPKHSKKGQQLWKVTRNKVYNTFLRQRYLLYSLYQVIDLVLLSLRLVKAYQHFLVLAGCSIDKPSQRVVIGIPKGRMLSQSAIKEWKLISEIEGELHAETIAWARRVARSRVMSQAQDQSTKDSFIACSPTPLIYFQKMFYLLLVAWRTIYRIFETVLDILFPKRSSDTASEGQLLQESSTYLSCFTLNLGKISVVVCPANAVYSASNEAKQVNRISYSDLLSFWLIFEELLFVCEDRICERYVSFSVGKIEVSSASISSGLHSAASFRKNSISLEEPWKGAADGKPIVWAEPAKLILHPGESEADFDLRTKTAAVPGLKKLLDEMPLTWKQLCSRFQESSMFHSRNPFLLCDIKSFWLYPGLKSPDLGIWKCSLGVGKLYFTLGYSEILSIVVLMKQILWNFGESACSGDTVYSPTCWTCQDLQEIQYEGRSKFYIKDMKMALCKLLPGKPIELGAVIAGPQVHLSLRKLGYLGNTTMLGEDGFHLKIDVHGINLAVWPATDSGHPKLNDVDGETFKLDEPRRFANFESDNISFVSQGNYSLGYYLNFDGLHADFVDSKEYQQMQFLLLKPVNIKLSSLRDYLCSFGETAVASSAVLCGSVEGGNVLLCVEELSVFFQVFEGLFPRATIYAFGNSDFNDDKGRAVSIKHEATRAKIRAISVQDSGRITLNSVAASCKITCTLEIDPFNIIVHGSIKSHSDSSPIFSGVPSSRNLGLSKFPATGIWLSTCKMFAEVSWLEHKMKLHADFSRFQAAIIKFKSDVWDSVGHFEDGSRFLEFVDCLYEVSLCSSSFSFLLNCLEETSLSETIHAAEEGTGSSSSPLATTNWLLVNVTFNMIFVGRSSIKNLFSGTHESNTVLSFSVGKDFQKVCFELQAGLICIDPTVLETFASCLELYLQYIRNLFFAKLSHGKERAEPFISDNHPIEGTTESVSTVDNPLSWKGGEDLTLKLSQFSVVLLSSNESGRVQEIMAIVDLCLDLKPKNKKLFSFYMKIHSQILKENMSSTVKKIQIPSDSPASSFMTSKLENGDSSEGLEHTERKNPVSTYASCSASVSAEKLESDSTCPVVQEIYGNHILKGLSAFISAEKLGIGDGNDCFDFNQGWGANGSIKGLDITISLSEIKMLMDCIESLSEVFKKGTSGGIKERLLPSANIQSEDNAEAPVPDGAIVAIKDICQHLYITVESEENKFCLRSTAHYSLVGEKALFRVRRQKQRKWNSQAAWFSLVSLHAKNEKGEPLQLSCCSGTGFVDISISKNSNDALWKVVSCKSESNEGGTDLELYDQFSKNTFYFVNKRNGCAVALLDGVPEFVNQPGNPFKFKIFHISSLACDQGKFSKVPMGVNGSDLGVLGSQDLHEQATVVPHIILDVYEVTLIIVDQFSDCDDKFHLVKGCLDRFMVTIQILPHKARVMSTLKAALYHFDAHKVKWRELVYPFQTYIFYRRRFCSQDTSTSFYGVPVLLHLGMRTMDVSLTELSLDILLHVIGKLDLAGPFAVKSSAILANCCKLENQSGVNLLCQFYDSQDVRVGRRQSALFFPRHIVNQTLAASYVSIKLESLGNSSTSPIPLPLSESQTFAWRTRIMSPKDARTLPGPFVVFDISKNIEEGLSIVVSPLLQIHNATEFSMELLLERPQQTETESARLSLKSGDVFDDCLAAFEAVNSSGGAKKALLSLSVGNFLLSFRPDIRGNWSNSNKRYSVEWSDTIEGEKAERLSGIIDKIGYRVRKALNARSSKYSFSIASCLVLSGDSNLASMHFLVQSIIRDVPVVKRNNEAESRNSMVAFLQQKEIFLLPTVRVYNLLQLDVHVLLTESDKSEESENIGNQATVSSRSTVELYANPAMLCFTVTLVAFNSSCKPVKSSDWIKKLNKKKDGIKFLDIDLDFYGGKYFASLRLTCDDRGVLEAMVFTSYTLKNDTDFPLFCFMPNQKKPLSRDEIQQFGSITPPHLGSFLPPHSLRSWFMKSNKLCITLLDEGTSQVTLDLDSLSGLTELRLSKTRVGLRHLLKLGVSLGPLGSTNSAPSEVVSMVPRYVVSNDTDEKIFVRQRDYEDDIEGIKGVNSKQKAVLLFVDVPNSQRRQIGIFDKILSKHRAANDDSSLFVQFRIDDAGFGWSGPVCVASLGRFFLKFKRSYENPVRQSDISKQMENSSWDFAAVNVVEEASSLVLHFSRPPASDLPYRIENHLPVASITYYQKGKFEPEAVETLPPGSSTNYVLDDLTYPHKLVVKVNGSNVSREISLDKLRPWKTFLKRWHHKELANRTGDEKQFDRRQPNVLEIGYEIYADGPTRVLRLCGSQDSTKKGFTLTQSRMRIKLRFSSLRVHLLEQKKQQKDPSDLPDYSPAIGEEDPGDLSDYSPIIVGRLGDISLDSVFSDKEKYHYIRVQSIGVDEKWPGAPFASMLRRHQLSSSGFEDNVLSIVSVLNPGFSNVKQVKHFSILLKPVDLKLDEETLLKVVPFWRKSLSQSTQSQQYYFDHFEIRPIKIIASFRPEESYSSYNSAQEALRTLLHSVIKIPAVNNAVVELNCVLVTHALVTTRELLIRCAQHYSWYGMRAIYIAKGSRLLPPGFTSMFDDLASSSIDVFFDPSSSLLNVHGLTLGTFKLMSEYIKWKGVPGTKRYIGDLGQTLRTAGSNVLFTAVTEISDSVLKGAESSGFNGMVNGFHHGILKLAMEPSLLGTAFLKGGPDRKIELNQTELNELYIEGYLQAMLDAIYKQEYLRVKVYNNQVTLKNLPPNSALIDEIVDRVKDFLHSKALLKGDPPTRSRSLRLLRGDKEWKFGPTMLTLFEHLFVSFTIRMLRKQTANVLVKIKREKQVDDSQDNAKKAKRTIIWGWRIGKFVMAAMVAYVDGRLCRHIPHPVTRRIVSGFLLSFLDRGET